MNDAAFDGHTCGLGDVLPDAIEMIEAGLIPFGLYGKKRATIGRNLILDMLKTPAVQEQIRTGRNKASG